jgi:hypothetical protein
MKRLIGLFGLFLAVGWITAQSPMNPASRIAGSYIAYGYGLWTANVYQGNTATGFQTIAIVTPTVTFADGRKIQPFAIGSPVKVGTEIVTPTSVTNCILNAPQPGLCKITANFAQTHSTADVVSSGTFGLQESLNDASLSGGMIIVDGAWAALGGTTTIVNNATVPGNVGIADFRTGFPGTSFPTGTTNQLLYYPFNGTSLVPLTLGTNLSITSGTLNASATAATNFSAITTGSNTTAAMTVGTGGSLAAAGSGSITATALPISGLTGITGAAINFGPATSFKVPSGAGFVTTADGQIGYDTTNLNFHVGIAAADYFLVPMPKTGVTSGHCAQFTLISAWWEISDAGAPCGSGGTGAFSALTSGTNTTAAMLVGTGASLGVTGSGTIAATSSATVATTVSTTNSSFSVLAASGTTGQQAPVTVASMTVNPSTGAVNVPGALTVGNPSGGVGSQAFLTQEGTVPSGYSASGQDNCYADSTAHGILCNFNAAGSHHLTLSDPFVTTPTWNGGGSMTWAIASSGVASLKLLPTHNTASTLNLTGLVNGGSYVVTLTQDATGTGTTTLNLGTGCTAWYVLNSTDYATASSVTITSTASHGDVLAFTYDGTNCWASYH